jgi:hypothetical protein
MVAIGGHLYGMAYHTLSMGPYGASKALVLYRLHVIPMQAVFIIGSIDSMGRSVTSCAHYPVIISPVPVERLKSGDPAIKCSSIKAIYKYIEIGMARTTIRFHQPGHTRYDLLL